MIQDILNQVAKADGAFEFGAASEAQRLAALERYHILDTAREEAFDRITGLAARLFEVPMVLVSLVDDERQWFKSVRGLEVCQTSREVSFCAHALHDTKVLVVPDALRDERFCDNPLVTDHPHIRFYAGAPLETPSGHIIGTLCVLDTEPRQFSVQQQQTLRDLAAMVVDEMELRLAQEKLGNRERAFRTLLDNSSDIITVLDSEGIITYESSSVESVLGYRPDELVGRGAFELVHPEDRELVKNSFARAALENTPQAPVEFRFAHRDGSWRLLEAIGQSRLDDPAVRGIVVNSRDITARKRDEAILREQQQQLKMAMRAGGMATWEWDARRNRMRWSDEMQTLFGPALHSDSQPKTTAKDAPKTASEASFAHDMGIEEFLQIVHPDDRALMLQALHNNLNQELAEDLMPDLRFRIVWRDGQVRHLASHGLSFRDENGVVERILGVTRDCTQAQQAQEELRQSEARFKNAFEQSDIGMALVAPDGHWLQVNRRLCDFLGYSSAELLQLDFQHLTHPDDLEKDLALVRQLLANEIGSYQLEKRYLRRDGSTMWGLLNVSLVRDKNGAPHNFISQIQDITERRHDEERLRLLESVAVHANDAIVITEAEPIDEPGPRILYVNEAFTRMSGHSREEVIGQTPRILQGPDTSRETCDRIRHALKRWKPVVAELVNYHKDGTPFWVELSIVPVADARGWFTHWVSVQRDVTHRHQVSQELMTAKTEAERANLAKSEFLSRMSHELRTPLNAILGFSQLLEMSPLRDEDASCARHILKAGRHLLALINEVLDIARIESGHVSLSLEPVAVAEVVREAFDMVRNQAAERQISFDDSALQLSGGNEGETSGENAPVFVMADRQRFTQIVVNLLSNAVKYNHEGGSITMACQRAGDHVALEVIDSGIGIAADKMELMFTPFERLGAENSEIEGTGVGLALSKRLAEAMNGTLEAHSELGRGTTFRLLLPPATNPLTRADAAHHQAAAPAIPVHATVLYIEDNASNLQLVERLLQRRPGVRLLTASRGDQGLEIALAEQPDLILLDLDLPGLHGRQVLERLRSEKHTFHTPIIIISADATPGQIERLLSNGANAFLTKPFDIADFLSTLDIHLATSKTPV